MPRLLFTVTNDLSYDQRMHRICTTLAEAGYTVTLIGRKLPLSRPLAERPYRQRRLRCAFTKGFLFYAEYNLRLFFFLLRQKADGICAIDLDTILPCYGVARLKGVQPVYDAHEYFTELKEVRTRPLVRTFWKAVEAFAVPKFKHGYTVSEGLAKAFAEKYMRQYAVIRNLPVLHSFVEPAERKPLLVFQGAVNEARGFEFLIPAMKKIPYKLVICGDGNFMDSLKTLIAQHGVQDSVELKGMMLPADLRTVAATATLGIGLAEKEGINQYFALPNKFLEYMHAGLPQVTMNFPEYQKINEQYRVAVLINSLDVATVERTINETMENQELLQKMRQNAMQAREIYCWQKEEKKLLHFYGQLFP